MPSYAGFAGLFEGVHSPQGLAAEPLDRLAVGLLEEFFAPDSDVVSRRNAIVEICQQLGFGGPSRRAAARVLAEAWQALELQGFICRDPEQAQGDWWFLTRSGREFLRRDDREAALYAALNPPVA